MEIDNLEQIFNNFNEQDYIERFRLAENDANNENVIKGLNKTELLGDFIEKFNTCSEIMHSSLFIGEFLLPEFDLRLNGFLEKARTMNIIIEFPSEDEQKDLLVLFDNGFKKLLSNLIALYIQFRSDVFRRLNNHGELIYNKDLQYINENVKGNEFDEGMREQIKLFAIHISISNFDFFTQEGNNQEINLKALIKDYYFIQKATIRKRELCDLLLTKCAFLIDKLIIRLRKNNLRNLLLLENGTIANIDFEKYPSDIYMQSADYIQAHYMHASSNRWNKALDYFCHLRNPRIEEMKVKDLIQSIKYYHKYNPSLKTLIMIRDHFYEKFRMCRQDDLFNLNAYGKCLNYAANCTLSLAIKLDDHNDNFKQIRAAYDKVADFQLITGVKNYYPHKEFFEFLVSKIELLNNNQDDQNIKKIEDYLLKSKDVLNTYLDCLAWSDRNLTTLIQLPFDECKLNHKQGFTEFVFINSTYFIPLHKTEITSDREIVLNNFQRANAHFLIAKDRQVGRDLIKKLGQADLRSMEILGMFSAMVSFVIGSITITRTVETTYEAVLFSSSLAMSLSVFVFLVIGLTRNGVRKIKEHWWLILIIVLLVTSFYILLYSFENHKLTLYKLIELIK